MVDLTPGSRRKLLRHIREGYSISELAREMVLQKRTIKKLINTDIEVGDVYDHAATARKSRLKQTNQENSEAAKARIAENALRKMRILEIREAGTAATSGKEIIEYWAAVHGLTVAEVKGRSRNHYISKVRQIAMYEIRRQLQRSLPEIGLMFDNRDHTTVLHAYERMKAMFNGGPAKPMEPIIESVLETVAKSGFRWSRNAKSGVKRPTTITLLDALGKAA